MNWTLPQEQIRTLGTAAADLFETLLALAVCEIVKGITVSALTRECLTRYGNGFTDRKINTLLKRLNGAGLLAVERYSAKCRDNDLKQRGDIRIRILRPTRCQTKINFDVRGEFGGEFGNDVGCQIPPQIQIAEKPHEIAPVATAVSTGKTPTEALKTQENRPAETVFSKPVENPSKIEKIAQEHQEQIKYTSIQEHQELQEQPKTESRSFWREVIDDLASKRPSKPIARPATPAPRRESRVDPSRLRIDATLETVLKQVQEPATPPPADLFVHRDRLELRTRLEKYFDLTDGPQRQVLCRVVYCAVDLGRMKMLEEYLSNIQAGRVRNPGGYLNTFTSRACSACGKSLKEIDTAGRAIGLGCGLNPESKKRKAVR